MSPRTGVVAALLYTLGVTLGAALIGLALGLLGLAGRWLLGGGPSPASPAVLVPIACLALVGGLRDLRFLSFPLPQPYRQVPRGLLSVFGPYRASFSWGLGVGLAYTTMVQYCLYYVVALWVLLIGDPLTGAEVLTVYGLAQGALLTVEVATMAKQPRSSRGLLGRGRTALFHRLGGAALVACAAFLLSVCVPAAFPATLRPSSGRRTAAPPAASGEDFGSASRNRHPERVPLENSLRGT